MPAPTSLAPSSSRPSPSQPLQPSYILRSHSTVVSLLRFTRDTDGYVVLWELRTRRARYCWKAHDGGVLGVDEFAGGVLTQGRDNNLRFFPLPPSASSSSSSVLPGAATAVHSHSSPTPGLSFDAPAEVGGPGMAWEMGVNAMTFCGMGLLRLPLPSGAGQDGKGKAGEEQALVAVVSLTKDEFVDILHLPSQSRLHRSIGSGAWGVGEKTGSVMALRLFHLAPPSSSSSSSAAAGPKEQLHLLVAYESGQLALFRFVATSRFERDVETAVDRPVKGRLPDEGEGWELVWVEKGHRDATEANAHDDRVAQSCPSIFSPDKRFAFTSRSFAASVAFFRSPWLALDAGLGHAGGGAVFAGLQGALREIYV
ncbi:Astra associated protein 1 Asa1 [Rhodosporidiobolus nylandii]